MICRLYLIYPCMQSIHNWKLTQTQNLSASWDWVQEGYKLLIYLFACFWESIFHKQLYLYNYLACTDIPFFYRPRGLNVRQRNLVEGFSEEFWLGKKWFTWVSMSISPSKLLNISSISSHVCSIWKKKKSTGNESSQIHSKASNGQNQRICRIPLEMPSTPGVYWV